VAGPGLGPTVGEFQIAVGDDELADLRRRLERTRFADDFANEAWTYGVEGGYLRELVEYWRDGFDWRAAEAAMNMYRHHQVVLDDVPIHFLHIRGTGAGPAMPLVLTHGWPWSFWDFRKVIGPLTDPERYGGDPRDAFDVVVPSLPGFAFSSPLRVPGIDPTAIAALWVRLMRDVLGYDRFGAQGGDWGAVVGAHLGHAHAEHLTGLHLSMPAFMTAAPGTLRPEDYGPDEVGWYERMRAKRHLWDSHLLVHTRDPQTLAWALNDSPVGLAAWLVERRRSWSDCRGDIETRFSKDDLLTTISLYWFTQTFHTTARLYADTFRSRLKLQHDRSPEIEAPTAIAVFPEETVLYPRAVAERHANLRQWTVMPRGGHFAAFEEPELLVDDVRKFFRTLR
jgi:pimeloyl-ACP methyl ester carboxylesterase